MRIWNEKYFDGQVVGYKEGIQNMKMIINAVGVQKLLEHDPEHTVELAKNAAAQVAQEIAQRIIVDRVERILLSHLRYFSEKGNAKDLAEKIIRDVVNPQIEQAIRSRLDIETAQSFALVAGKAYEKFYEECQAKILKGTSDKIDTLIRQRFAAAFGGSDER